MGWRTTSWVWALLLVGLFIAGGCAGGGRLLENGPLPATILPQGKAQPLAVVHAAPTGELTFLEQAREITVVFNQPMVPLGVERVDLPGLKIEPPLAGAWRWRGTACLTFTPQIEGDPLQTKVGEESLRLSQDYSLTIPAGITSLQGQKLAQNYTLHFVTPRPRVIDSRPQAGERNVSLKSPIFLVFNEKMADPASWSMITLTSNRGLVACQVGTATEAEAAQYRQELSQSYGAWAPLGGAQVEISTLKAEQILALRPKRPLELGLKYTVTVPEGFKASAQAEKGALAPFSLSFQTYNIFSLKSLTSAQGHRPDSPLEFTFTNPVEIRQLARHLHFTPALEIPERYLESDFSAAQLSLELPLRAQTTYQIKVDAELQDVFGNRLAEAENLPFTTTDFTPQVRLSGGQVVVESQLGGRLPLAAINVPTLTVQSQPLTYKEIISLAERDQLYGDNVDYRPARGFKKTQKLIWKGSKNRWQDRHIELKPLLGGDKEGWLYLRLTYRGAQKDESIGLVVQVTDLALTAKFARENSLVWITSLESGKPVAGAQATLYDASGKVLIQAKSDAQGLVRGPGWAQSKGSKGSGETRQYWVVQRGSDRAYVASTTSNELYSSAPDTNYSFQSGRSQFLVNAFSDRQLYRAGEKIHFKGVARSLRQGQLQLPQEIERLQYRLRDSQGQILAKGQVSLSEYGSWQGQVAIPAQASSGYAALTFLLPQDKAKKLGMEAELYTIACRIEEYKPAQFEVEILSAQKADQESAALAQGEWRGQLRGRFLYGAPMANDPYRYQAFISPTYYTNPQYPGFEFGNVWDESPGWSGDLQVASAQGRLDEQGQVPLSISLRHEGLSRLKGPAQFWISGSVTSPAYQELSTLWSAPLWPSDRLVGVRLNSPLARAGQKVEGEIVALDRRQRAAAGARVKVDLIHCQWNSVLKAGVGGSYAWHSERIEQMESTQTVVTQAKATPLELNPRRSGFYLVRLSYTSAKGEESQAQTSLWVGGDDYVAWEREDTDEISLVADASTYRAGQKAKVLVQSPYEEAQALITLESDSILHTWVQELRGSAPIIEVPLSAKYAPNAYLSVILLQGRQGRLELSAAGLDVGRPSFKFGYLNLKIENPQARLQLKVQSDKETYKPGERAVLNLTLRDAQGKPQSGEVCLWMVDEGVLQLVNYQLPSYYDTFYAPRSLQVRTAESCADVIGMRSYGSKGANPGGGGGAEMGELQDVRRNFKALALWQPSLKIGPSGQTQVVCELPDTLTRYRIMALACSQNYQFGEAQEELQVSEEVSIIPALPAFARAGDTFQVGAIVTNHTSKRRALKVIAHSPALALEGLPKAVSLAPGEEVRLNFPARANQIGEYEIVMGPALQPSLQSAYPFRVIADPATAVVAVSGQFDGPSQSELLKLESGAQDDSLQLEVALANDLSCQLQGAIKYLWDQEEETLDRLLGRINFLLLAPQLGIELPPAYATPAKRRQALSVWGRELGKYQIDNGSWVRWPNQRLGSDDYLSAWTLLTIAHLQKADIEVPSYIVQTGLEYLQKTIKRRVLDLDSPEGYWGQDTLPMLLAAACAHHKGQTSTLVVLYRARQTFNLGSRAFLLQAAKALGHREIVASLRQEFQNSLQVEERQAWFQAPARQELPPQSVRAMGNALIVRNMLTSGGCPQAAQIFNWIFAQKEEGHWSQELNDVAVAQALATYLEFYPTPKEPMQVQARVGGQGIVEGQLDRQRPYLSGGRQLSTGSERLAVEMSKSGPGRLYYDLLLRYAPSQPLPPTDRGFTLLESCYPLQGERPIPWDSLKLGQTYRLLLTVISPRERAGVEVRVPLAAGLEVIDGQLATTDTLYTNLLRKVNTPARYGTFLRHESYPGYVKVWAEGLHAGEHQYTLLVRAVTPGRFRVPGSWVYQRSQPEVFGCTGESSLTIVP